MTKLKGAASGRTIYKIKLDKDLNNDLFGENQDDRRNKVVSGNRQTTNQNSQRRPVQIQSANQDQGSNYGPSQTKYVKYEQPYQEKEIVYDIQGNFSMNRPFRRID